MSERVTKEFETLKDAVIDIKERLKNIDKKNKEYREVLINIGHNTEMSMEEANWSDKLYLVYRNDGYDDAYYQFDDDYDITCWLDDMWSDWDLWEYGDRLNGFFEENLVIWEFHRNICIDKYPNLYNDSKQFIDGWSRKRVCASFEAVPTFSIG